VFKDVDDHLDDDSSEDHPDPIDFSHNRLLERSGLILHLIVGVQKGSVNVRLCMAASSSWQNLSGEISAGKAAFSLGCCIFG
jgi:hypothetical protein